MSTELKRYTVDDVGRHHRTDDAWVIVDRRVYDITTFLNDHPGGLDVLRDHLGHDVSSIMRDESSHQHTGPAFELLEEYCIGTVDDGTMVSCTIAAHAVQAATESVATVSNIHSAWAWEQE